MKKSKFTEERIAYALRLAEWARPWGTCGVKWAWPRRCSCTLPKSTGYSVGSDGIGASLSQRSPFNGTESP